MIRVFILASTPMIQAGLHALLSTADVQIVGTSAVPDAFLESLQNLDVIVAADESQLDEITHALAQAHSVALIVLTNNAERIVPKLQTLNMHGWGIVPLDAAASQLQAAVTSAAQGLVTLPQAFVQWLYSNAASVNVANLEGPEESLTPREREVLELVSQGLSNKLIARRLQISEHTVKFHVSSVSTKLGASSRTDAVWRGLRRGLITL